MQPTQSTIPPAKPRETDTLKTMRSPEFRPRRSIWPGLLAAAVIAAGVTAAFVSNYYDDRTLGTRVDATVAAAGTAVHGGIAGLRDTASGAAQGTADAADRVAGAVGDVAITAAVKTALAADPSLSAVKIDVTTHQGAVLLEGPAPDEKSRRRAEVLATAPQGVARVDNRLVVPPAAAAPAVRAATLPPRPAAKPVAPSVALAAPLEAAATPAPAVDTSPAQ